MDFITFKNAITKQFEFMQTFNLYVTDTDPDELWNLYLNSFPSGTNPIFRERSEHDCQACKAFIRQAGNIVAIDDSGNLLSIWDTNITGTYKIVANALSKYVKSQSIRNILAKSEANIGTNFNIGLSENDKPETWHHFYLELPNKYIFPSDNIGTFQSKAKAAHDVFLRGLQTITLESIEITLDLIDSKRPNYDHECSIYRGEEHLEAIKAFQTFLIASKEIPSEQFDLFVWLNHSEFGARIRNTVIGTLLTDISKGIDLDIAILKFEDKVDPGNYHHPKKIITKMMINKAQQKAEELCIIPAFSRRYATVDDLTINNVLFADNSTKKSMNVFDELTEMIPIKPLKNAEMEEISIADFMTKIIQNNNQIEILFEANQMNNLVSLIAPINADAPNILKWNNNFSWSYNGEVTDSMRTKVKAQGGDVTGDLRFSINWAEDKWIADESDLDAWAKEPSGKLIGFDTPYVKKKGVRTPNTGQLDVDILNPSDYDHKNIVENITWLDKTKMTDGTYYLWINQYKAKNSLGVKTEVEFDKTIFQYEYNQPVHGKIRIADVTLKDNKFTIKHHLTPIQELSQSNWNINTNTFHKVRMIMNSPNHWDTQSIGNKHYFFMLEDCLNPGSSRGFYNEFLSSELSDHRKVFEVLGSKMATPPSANQVSGLGFSTTQRASFICKVSGISSLLKVMF